MKESISTTLLLNIIIVFIFIYVAFLALAINYSKAFRVKNELINIIEQSEGCGIGMATPNFGCGGKAGMKINLFLNDVGYNQKDPTIIEYYTDRGPYYAVTTYIEIKFDISFILASDNYSN